MTGHPKRPDKKTYPALTPDFESINTPGLYVIGAASHGLDRYRYENRSTVHMACIHMLHTVQCYIHLLHSYSAYGHIHTSHILIVHCAGA